MPKSARPLQQGQPYMPKSAVPDEKTLDGFAGNVVKSAGSNLAGMASGLVNMVNPDADKNTIYQMGKLAYGGMQKLDPTADKSIARGIAGVTPLKYIDTISQDRGQSTDYTPYADAVGEFYKQRYGGLDNIGNTFYNDPIGMAFDVSTVAGGGAGLAKAGGLGKTASALSKVAEFADPLQVAGKVSKFIPKPKLNMAEWFAKQAETLPTRGMGEPTLVGKAKGMSPIPLNDLFEKYNLWDRSPETFLEGARQAGSKLDDITAKYESTTPKFPKKTSAEEFVKAKFEKPTYGMGHRPTLTGATADNITQEVSEMGFPKDFYRHPEYYEDVSDKAVQESWNVLKKIKGNPDAEVTIYRASPKNELNAGDWITLSKEYARRESLTEGVKVNSFKVKAKDIHFAGDSINEFGYYPRSQLTDIYNQANKNKLIQTQRDVAGKIDVQRILNSLDKNIKRLEKDARFSDASRLEMEELIKRRDMISNAYRGSRQAKPTSITYIKNQFQKDVPDSQFGLPTSETAKAKGTKTAYKQILTALEEKIPGTKGLGRESSSMRKLFEVAKGAERRSVSAQPIKLKGLLSAGAGATLGGMPGALGGYVMNEFLNSPTFLKYLTKTFTKLGKAKAPKTNIFKDLYNTGKIERMANPR